MSIEPFPEEYLRQLQKKYSERRAGEFNTESPVVIKYFQAVSNLLKDQYTIDKVLAVGGTGIVHTGQHNRFNQPIVLKINRPHIEPEATSMVENEAQVLPKLSHPNIISVLDLGRLKDFSPPLTYIVEPFISGSKPFFIFDKDRKDESWLVGKVEELKSAMPPTHHLGRDDETGQTIGLVSAFLTNLATLFSQWVSLVSHLHESGYVYLDVKPENVLIDKHSHLTSIDYGSVERLDHTDLTPIEVYFTERYAHPELIQRKKEKASSNRVRGGLRRSDLTPAFDYYALGISMLEILNEVALIRPHVVPQLPLFRSLHFLATRLLNGRNSGRPEDNHYPYACQVFPSLQESDYRNLGYEKLTDVIRDLDKELGRWSLEAQVPELATYSKDIVRVVPGFNTVLTPRLRGIIEHPLVARLKYITQLGLVSLVYPTADHSRFDHALGSYTYTTYYLKSLFNDLGNPLFRNLVSTEDFSAVLLAALLHDLGQYPLAHDLEEVHEGIFKHATIGTELLAATTKDQADRTLAQIIEDPSGWNVRIDALRRVLGGHSKNLTSGEADHKSSLKTNLLAAIIDGQVDADKADYIIRDSARCELPYGQQLDVERLLRVLTVAIIPEEVTPERRITIGVYDKGLVSAHAFGQARYELLSTVYWHHTARILKCMLQYATALGLPLSVFGPKTIQSDAEELKIREQLLEFVRSLVPPFKARREKEVRSRSHAGTGMDMYAEPTEDVIETLESDKDRKNQVRDQTGKEQWYPGIAWTDWLVLQWVASLPNASVQSGNLVRGIQNRRLYKRIATFARGGPYRRLIATLDERRWDERIDLCRRFHDTVYDRLKRNWTNLTTTAPMNKSDLDKLAAAHQLVLIDIPKPGQKIGYDRPLGVVPELKERLYHQDARNAAEDTAWRQIMEDMVAGSAPVRVLCHPDLRNVVSAVYASTEGRTPTTLENNVAEALAQLLGLERP